MKSSLLTGLEEAQKDILRKEFASSAVLRRRLRAILEKEIEILQTKMLNEKVENIESYAILQNGYVSEIKAIKKLVAFL